MDRIWLLVFLSGLLLPGVQRVWGMEISTTKEVEAVNGTSVKLTCTFTSTHPVSPQTVIVSWNFQPVNSKHSHRVFYYQEDPHPPPDGIFKGHVVWSGDIMRKDASITLHDVQPIFNGTYSCRVTNNPDVHGEIGKTDLRIVNKSSLSELSILGAIVGVSCAFVLILLGIYVAWKLYRKRQRETDIEMHLDERFEKDPTVWCSDDEESKESSGDGEEEGSIEKEDDDDDEDGDD
ncbi:myelin protein zero-like protein 2 [Fundulus diaphanus]